MGDKIIIACEFSGIIRDSFIRMGYDAISCDLIPSESNYGPHIQGDIRNVDLASYSLMIAHPPCTYLCVSGARWFSSRLEKQEEAIDFFKYLYYANVNRICIENPVSIMSSKLRKPDQYIEPYLFGNNEYKKTGLWLKNLPKLIPTKICGYENRKQTIHKMNPNINRNKERSRTYLGIAEAMVSQWGPLLSKIS